MKPKNTTSDTTITAIKDALTAGTRTTVLVTLALAVLVGTATTGVAADVGGDRPAQVDGGTEVPVVLEDAPDGVQLYNVTVTLEGPSGASIESASAGDIEGFEVRSLSADAVTFRAADLGENVQPGASNVELASITVSGAEEGEVDLSTTVHQFENDEGDTIEPPLTLQSTGGGGPVSDITESLPGSPVLWAVGALVLTMAIGMMVALRR